MCKARKCSWTVLDRSYHDTHKREKALYEISEEMGATVEKVKAKILNLRTQIGCETAKLRKTKSGQSSDMLHKSSWVYWEHLHFLQASMQAGRSKDSIGIQRSQQCPTSIEIESDIEEI